MERERLAKVCLGADSNRLPSASDHNPAVKLFYTGPLVNVDPNRPYPFDARVQAGATRARLVGHIAHPFNFGQINGMFSVTGADLADLYYLSGLAFPNRFFMCRPHLRFVVCS